MGVSLSLTAVQLTESITEEICEGESYVFGSQTLTTSGVYEETFTSASGCDSVVTLTLSVLPELTESIAEEIS